MRSVLMLLVCVMSLAVNAKDTMTEAFETLSLVKQTEVFGEFEQRKKIKILKNSLVSKGVFNANSSGFVWQQVSPVASIIRMDDSGVYSEDHLGTTSKMNNADMYIPLLQALLLQDPKLLSNYLSVNNVDSDCMGLTAKAPLDQVFSEVRLCGQGTISKLVLRETAGHVTEINLSYGQAH